jgi:hypothetical protein
MKKLLIMLIVCCVSLSGSAQDFSAAEYFFDNDPGVGNGTSLALGATATPMSFSSTISIASLSPGFHILAVRVRQSDGMWSSFESRGFIVSVVEPTSVNVGAAEYFFDSDPGEGNGVPITVTTGATTNFTIVTPTGSLAPGFHFLAIRSKGIDGMWGIFESRGFYITSAASNVTDIVGAEYFFDTDPGTGAGTALVIPNGSTSNFTASLPGTGLSNGFHFLVVRTKDSEGKWSVFESRGFYINNEPTAPISIVALEYYVDVDPGEGNGKLLSFTTPAANVDETFVISMPANLSAITHTLGVRVLDDRGMWSFQELAIFNMTSNIIPDAIAGSDQTISLPVNTVTLNGAASNDADGSISYFYWTKISGPVAGTISSQFLPITNVTDLIEGVYEFELRVVDNEGVSDRDTIMVTVNNGSCPATPIVTQNDNTLIVDDASSDYQWFVNGVAVDGATTNTFTISLLEYGVYAVVVTNNGCTVRSDDYVYLITGSKTERVKYKIFPNPSEGKFFVSVSSSQISMDLMLIDALGRVVYKAKLKSGLNLIDDDVLAQGIYYLMIDGKPVEKIERR